MPCASGSPSWGSSRLFAAAADMRAVLVRKRLTVLGEFPTARALLRTRPEYAGLLAAVTDADAAAAVLAAVGEDAPALVNLLLLAADRPARGDAVVAFARQGHRIARLQRMGAFGVETLFPPSASRDGDRAFDRWLANA